MRRALRLRRDGAGITVNDDVRLEREADLMGARASVFGCRCTTVGDEEETESGGEDDEAMAVQSAHA